MLLAYAHLFLNLTLHQLLVLYCIVLRSSRVRLFVFAAAVKIVVILVINYIIIELVLVK